MKGMQGSGYLYIPSCTTTKIYGDNTRIKRDSENTYAIFNTSNFLIQSLLGLILQWKKNCFKGNRIGAESWIDGFLCGDSVFTALIPTIFWGFGGEYV